MPRANLSSMSQLEYSEYLFTTTNLEKIEDIVYRGTHEEHDFIVRNPLLTEVQCRQLFLTRDLYMLVGLVKKPVFPADLLYSLALTENSPQVQEGIAGNPNSDEETLTILALRMTRIPMV